MEFSTRNNGNKRHEQRPVCIIYNMNPKLNEDAKQLNVCQERLLLIKRHILQDTFINTLNLFYVYHDLQYKKVNKKTSSRISFKNNIGLF